MRTLFKILGIRPRRLRRPKMIQAVQVRLTYTDGRPDVMAVLTPYGWEILSFALTMGNQVGLTQTADGQVAVFDLRNLASSGSQYIEVQVLER